MSQTEKTRKRRRWQLIGIFSVFLVPPMVAALLGMTGWRPGTNGHGEPVIPQQSVAEVSIPLASDGTWAWVAPDKPRMTLVALAGPDCAKQCLETLHWMHNAQITLDKKQARLRLLFLGTAPDSELATRVLHGWAVGKDPSSAFDQFRPQQSDSVSALLVESNGTALSWYPAGFEPEGLKDDLHRVVR